jgi:hypothetical protein
MVGAARGTGRKFPFRAFLAITQPGVVAKACFQPNAASSAGCSADEKAAGDADGRYVVVNNHH